ncbi:MAG: hydantoinase/oxoprolinase family protein [Desulfobulbaceae bacterium]|nr:hydantoinase/oxoprolinase family protein [Desulfobulbaceae bacterium]
MRIGIDIGGTHSDGVLIGGQRLLAAAKARTHHDDLLASINLLLKHLLAGQDASLVQCINLSTTLTTNAIITGRVAKVAVLVSAGPGISAHNYQIGDQFHHVAGSLNHVGFETAAVEPDELAVVRDECQAAGISHFAVVGKFSPRNPEHELQIADSLKDAAGAGGVVCCGHQLSGQLNFGRRINSTYFNAAVWEIARNFAGALKESLHTFGLGHAEVNILKADGGTLPLARSLDAPVQSILSGPAASVMGILATMPVKEDVVLLDIGGTTTDIALFAGGQPLLEREGIAIAGRPTLVRALRVSSIGIGGDSCLHVDANGAVRCGPERLGPCMAAGGDAPALMDAFNALGQASFGDVAASKAGITALAQEKNMEPEALAQTALQAAASAIDTAVQDLIEQVNSKPVYTIHEILEERRITPRQLVLIGGPAAVFQPLLQEKTGMETLCPDLASVTNAIGAALCRSTGALVLHADTARGKLYAPTLNVDKRIARNFTLEDAVSEAKNLLYSDMTAAGVQLEEADLQVTQADSFNMIEGGYNTGKNIRVQVQVKPAVLGQAEAQPSLAVAFAE